MNNATKIEKSVPWVIIMAIGIIVLLGMGIVLKEVLADTFTQTLTAGNNTPSVGTVTLNGGSDITLTENATATVQATATVTDVDGYSDISTTTGKLFRSGVGSSCSADDNNCYSDSSCVTSSCSGNSCVATCEYDVWFHADPTDTGDYSTQYWDAWIKAIDTDNASSSATTTGNVDMNTLRALDVTSDDWLGISGAHVDSFSYANSANVEPGDMLDDTSPWVAWVAPDHWFIIDLGQTYAIKKFRGRSYSELDPTDVDLYVSDSKTVWGDAVATGISAWDDVDTWQEVDSTDKNGRYIKAVVHSTNHAENHLMWGDQYSLYAGSSFDAYGDVGINYGSLNSGSTTGSTNQGVTTTATGNVGIEVYVYGDDMEKGSDSIGVEYQEYSTSTFTYGDGTTLSNSSTSVGVEMSKPTSHPSTSTDDIYWGAEVPAVTPKGTYHGTTTFGAGVL